VWKTTTVWRWPVGWVGADSGAGASEKVRAEIEAGVWGERGGREARGTLHYLRYVLIEGR
jgi:hypothetical protein